jgi:uncharacterized protein (UPF0179 family)
MSKGKLTLVGLKQAKIGFTFIHEGSSEGCEECERKKICLTTLEPGRIYRVMKTRDKVFPCIIHEDGVQVVEVTEPDHDVSIETRLAFPSGIITFTSQECQDVSCQYYKHCVPLGLVNGDKCKILHVKDPLKCPVNHSLVLVQLQRVLE